VNFVGWYYNARCKNKTKISVLSLIILLNASLHCSVFSFDFIMLLVLAKEVVEKGFCKEFGYFCAHDTYLHLFMVIQNCPSWFCTTLLLLLSYFELQTLKLIQHWPYLGWLLTSSWPEVVTVGYNMDVRIWQLEKVGEWIWMTSHKGTNNSHVGKIKYLTDKDFYVYLKLRSTSRCTMYDVTNLSFSTRCQWPSVMPSAMLSNEEA